MEPRKTQKTRKEEPSAFCVFCVFCGSKKDVAAPRRVCASLSAKGVAVAVERVLGLAAGPAPKAGLYLPESIIPPAHLMTRLRELGVEVR